MSGLAFFAFARFVGSCLGRVFELSSLRLCFAFASRLHYAFARCALPLHASVARLHIALALRFVGQVCFSRSHVTPALRICMLLLRFAYDSRATIKHRIRASHFRFVAFAFHHACVLSRLRFVFSRRAFCFAARVRRAFSHAIISFAACQGFVTSVPPDRRACAMRNAWSAVGSSCPGFFTPTAR